MDCNMYHTGIGGTIQSYNWQGGLQITGSKWTTCIRREDGYCHIGYRVVDGQTIDTFQVDDTPPTTAAANVSVILIDPKACLVFLDPIYKTTNVCPMSPAPPILMKLGIYLIHSVKIVLK